MPIDVPTPDTLDPIVTRTVLDRSLLLRELDAEQRVLFCGYLDSAVVTAGTVVVREGETVGDLFFILEGEARLARKGVDLSPLSVGAHFGELGLIAGRPRAATITAATTLQLARLSRAAFDRLAAEHPELALGFLRSVVSTLGHELTEMTDSVGQLLTERSLPRRTVVQIRLGDEIRPVKTGTPLRAILPATIDGKLVVAGLLDRKPVSLNTPVASDAAVEPLTTAHWEGRKIYRRSVGLVLLEAARRVAPNLDIRLGPAMGTGQLVEVDGFGSVDKGLLATTLVAAMREIAAADATIRVEWWTLEEARTHFADVGWSDAAKLLRFWRHSTVRLVSCGEAYALVFGVLLPSTGAIRGFDLLPSDKGLLLLYGDESPAPVVAPGAADPVQQRPNGHVDESKARDVEHEHWLRALNVTSVGALSEHCVSGQVSELIRVAEGFHEKRIGRIADRIATRDGVRVICIAGPSSSGKTTFIKRLCVQLQVNGLHPIPISLDNYYVDRERTTRDEKGDLDFEHIEALDLPVLHDHLGRLLAGETIHTPRYDFAKGKSFPGGGPELHLGAHDILMLEGIHGLNPRLLGTGIDPGRAFRIFIHPMTALAFDRLTRVSASDIRLLRRIVRDRHHRGYSAAENILRWPSVRRGEHRWIFPFQVQADVIFDSALIYEMAVLKVFADRYLLEVAPDSPAYPTAFRLRQLIDRFITIYPDHVPPTSILREFIGGSGFEY